MSSFEKLTYKEGTSQIDKNSGHDHMVDAATYAIEYLFPITDNRPMPEQPGSWSMAVR
jgi:hypothetical protein